MNTYVCGDREVVVMSHADKLEMPEVKGGSMKTWTKKENKLVVPVAKLPPVLTQTPATLPPSTPATPAK